MLQPQGSLAAFCLAPILIAGALAFGLAAPAAAQSAEEEKVPRAPDGTPFVIELYPEKYDTPYLQQSFGHLLYLSPRQPPVDAGELIGRLLEELGPFTSDRTFQRKSPTYCLYVEPGAPEFESEAWERVKEQGIDLRPVTARERGVAARSGECVLVTVAAAPAEDLPPPFLEVEQRVFETEEPFVVLRGRVTAAAGLGPLYLDKEPIPYDRETGRIEYRLEMPEPGEERAHLLFALDQAKQESEAVRLTLRRIEIPPPRIHDYTEAVESEHEIGKIYGYVTAQRPLESVTVDGARAKLDRDSGYFEAPVSMPAPGAPRRLIVIEARDVNGRRDVVRVALVRNVPPPPPEVPAPPVIVADRSAFSSRAETVEITGHVESKLAIAAVRIGDRLAALDGHGFRATVVMPAPFENATLLVTATDVEGNRAEPVRIALERLPWCPAGMLTGGDELRRVQERLNRLDYDAGPADGLFGRRTSTAMDAFWKRQAGEAACTRGEFLDHLDDAVDETLPTPEAETEVAEIPQPPVETEPPLETEPPIVTEEGPVEEAEMPQPPRDTTTDDTPPPDPGLDERPITAWDDKTTVTGQATGDMTGWTLTVENIPVRVAADGSFRFPVEDLACGTNWFRVGLQGPGGRFFASLLEVRRTTPLGTWYCHVSTAPPWLWILPAALLLLAVAAAAKLRKTPPPPAAPQIRLQADRGTAVTAEVMPGPRLSLALRFEDTAHTTGVVAPAAAIRLKEVAR